MDILLHSALPFVEFGLLLILVTRLLLDRELNGKFLAAWTTLGLLALAALTHTPSSLAAYLYLPLFLSPWTVSCTLLAAVILREYRREYKLLGQRTKNRSALFAGAVTATAAGILCWNVKLGGLGAPLLVASFVLLGYCAQANRKVHYSNTRRPSS